MNKAQLALKKARAARLYFRRRHRDYAVAFQAENASAQRVLADIRGFCTGQPLGSPNPFEMARSVGRREVWDHIQEVLGYTEKEAVQLGNVEREQREREFASA
jgi:hypothetical protein